MRLVIIGCEYAGKTTLALGVGKWLEAHMGCPQFGKLFMHDHFVRPFVEGYGDSTEVDPEVAREEAEEAEQVLAMTPKLLEKYSRYLIHYHLGHSFYLDNHHILVNWYYGDAVYAPLYYGYGGADEYADRQVMARHYDAEVMDCAPDTVLVLMKAAPEVIRRRMAAHRHPYCPLKDQDIELVLQRFEQEYTRSGLRRRFTLDTSEMTAEETLQGFLRQMQPHFNQQDQLALLTYTLLKA